MHNKHHSSLATIVVTSLAAACLAGALFIGCDDKHANTKPIERANGVAATEQPTTGGRTDTPNAAVSAQAEAEKAAESFCSLAPKTTGPGAIKLGPWPTRPLPAAASSAGGTPNGTPNGNASASVNRSWKWINLWATWCKPCVEEMGLLRKWRDSMKADGIDMQFELWSVDEDGKDLASWVSKDLAGPIKWFSDATASKEAVKSMGLAESSAIPIHVLVDPDNNIRCVRVSSVRVEDYGNIRKMLAGWR